MKQRQLDPSTADKRLFARILGYLDTASKPGRQSSALTSKQTKGSVQKKSLLATALSKRKGGSLASSAASSSVAASAPQGKQKAIVEKLSEDIESSLNDVRNVYNTAIKRHKQDEERIERMQDRQRKSQRHAKLVEARKETNQTMESVLDTLSKM
eukprot:jgi/Hompol1/4709/HPOL_002299-RA